MVLTFTQESDMEQELINTLTTGDSQWHYRPDIRNDDDLWANFFDLLETNNKARLGDNPLTEDEKSQIRMQLNFGSFYDAGVWLAGENGVAQVKVQRTDASLGTIHLAVHDRQHIAGGSSVYQVVNQLQRGKVDPGDRNRRMDVTLLINGLPLIHIELKSRRHSVSEAFEQIVKYDGEKKFTGLLSLTQLFVISNGSQTQYIAANKHYQLDPNYLNTWVTARNQSVRDLSAFAREVLSIPMAHELVTDYMVLDGQSRTLIAMRPYQIHATKAVLNAVGRDESGYIWHTTGSGKTLTSYKTSKTLLRRRSLDKVLFLVDRKDLDTQTTSTFEAYAAHDVLEVDGTDNVEGLIKALLRPNREVIVTTAQKLQHLLKRYEREDLGAKRLKERDQLRGVRLAFVVDEAHRAVSSEQQRYINRFFRQPVQLWYGFTGTPIFSENKKQVKGDLEATTPEQYGRELHRYTVKEAIHDGNVLSFHVEYSETIDEDGVVEVLKEKHDPLYVEGLSQLERESKLPESLYTDEQHMLEVIEQILNRSTTKLGLGEGTGKTYSGILTVPSIKQAGAYYRLFKQVLNGDTPVTLKEKVSKKLVDFPKLALTYSLTENQADSRGYQAVMAEAIADYNQLFGTRFTLETIDAYNHDLTERLARKHDRYQMRSQQLDIVIVVDRLLTGFDAPCVSTLFIDRPIMPPHTLIQAFSRTNRLHGKKKANIVTFRTPTLYKEAVRQAIKLYSAGSDPEDVMAPVWEKAKATMLQCVKRMLDVDESIEDVLGDGVPKEKQQQYAQAFQQLDRAYSDIQVYKEYLDEKEDNPDDYLRDTFGISEQDLEAYHGVYVNVIDRLRKTASDEDGDVVFDIEYRLASRYREEIDYQYILALMDRHQASHLTPEERKEVTTYIDELSQVNPQLGQLLKQVWAAIQVNPELVADRRAIDVLGDYQTRHINTIVADLATTWHVSYDVMAYFVANYSPSNSTPTGWGGVVEAIKKGFSHDHNYPVEGSINRLTVGRKAEAHIFDTLNEQVVPLTHR